MYTQFKRENIKKYNYDILDFIKLVNKLNKMSQYHFTVYHVNR